MLYLQDQQQINQAKQVRIKLQLKSQLIKRRDVESFVLNVVVS